MAKEQTRFIRLAASGIKAVGAFKAGEVYEIGKDVDAKEADRLVKVKGFEYTSAAPAAINSDNTQGGE